MGVNRRLPHADARASLGCIDKAMTTYVLANAAHCYARNGQQSSLPLSGIAHSRNCYLSAPEPLFVTCAGAWRCCFLPLAISTGWSRRQLTRTYLLSRSFQSVRLQVNDRQQVTMAILQPGLSTVVRR